MLSTSAVSGSSLSALQRGIAGNVEAPETGLFDFMNYLLGLQGQSQDWLSTTNDTSGLLAVSTEKENSGADEALLSLFNRKDQNQLDPIALSSLFPQNATPVNNPILIKTGAENLRGLDSQNASKNLLAQSGELKNAVSSLDFQGTASLQLMQQASKNSDNIEKESANFKVQKENALQQYLANQGVNPKADDTKAALKNTVTPASEHSEVKSEASLTDTFKHNELSSSENLKSEGKHKGHQSDQLMMNSFALGVDPKFQNNVSDVGSGESKGHVIRATLPQMFEKVQSMVHHGNGKMTVALNPPTLGQVEIHVTTRGKNVEISMKSENDFAKSAIEGSLSDLRSSMEAQDLNLTKMEVQVHRDFDKQVQGDFVSNWVGQDSAFQQSRGFNRDNSTESPWREPSDSASLKPIGMSSRLGSISSASRLASVGQGHVDIRI